MEVIVEHLGDVQFQIKARQHTIVSDQPLQNGGFDEGMTPPEMLLAALGSLRWILRSAVHEEAQAAGSGNAGARLGREGGESGTDGQLPN